MTKFKVEYSDPETDERKVDFVEFETWVGRATVDEKEVGPVLTITAKEWAEDYAYTVADKGRYEVTEIEQ